MRNKIPCVFPYKILPSSRERATPSLRMGNHALVARPRVLTCPPPGAHCPHTPRIHHAAARPAWASPKTSWPPKHASPRRLVCTKPHTRDSHKSMGWRMVAHHALHAGNGQTSGSWPDQQVLAPQPCMGAAPNPCTPPSKGLQTLPFYCQCPDNTADGLTTTPVSIPAPPPAATTTTTLPTKTNNNNLNNNDCSVTTNC